MTVYLSPDLGVFDWVEHGFATRHAMDWFDQARLAHLKQIHSDAVVVAGGAGHWGEGDALITNIPGVLVGIRTADCVPLLIVDPAQSKRGASWLAKALGVSDQRARKLLAQGRVRGARKDIATGQWDLSDVAIPRVRAGRRGPGLRSKSSRAR